MHDIFADIFADETKNPMESARRAMRPRLRPRFYLRAEIGESADGFLILLDGKPIRTPAARALAMPARSLAEAIAAEWDGQQDVIDPKKMPLTRLANSIIDGVTENFSPVAAEIAKFLGSDLLFYRAEAPEDLRVRQEQQWNPVLDWAAQVLDARFILTEGVAYVRQPDAAIANATKAIPNENPNDAWHDTWHDAWRLGALHSVTSLTGSALLALALMHGQFSVQQVWAAAHVDEDWQMEQWGRDELAVEQRAFRFQDLQAAATVLAHLKV